MTTAFETELTATLHELADEVGTGPDNLATTAYRDGRRLRRRRTILTTVASVIALAVLATPAFAVIAHRNAIVAGSGTRTTITLQAAALPGATADMRHVQDLLGKRFAAAGLPATISTTASGLQIVVHGNVPMAKIESLISPSQVEFRTVIDSFADTTPQNAIVAPPATDAAPPTLAQVKAKLGSAYQIAAAITDPSTVTPTIAAGLAPFATLTPAEVSVLSPAMQFAIPTISCAQLSARPYGSTLGAALSSEIVACERDDNGVSEKYLLDVATITSADIAGAEAGDNVGGAGGGAVGWQVSVSLNGPGQRKWSNLTAQLMAESDPATNYYKQVAVVIDAQVITAPQILAQIPGPMTISGGFTKTSATSLANLVRYGALPVALSVTGRTVR